MKQTVAIVLLMIVMVVLGLRELDRSSNEGKEKELLNRIEVLQQMNDSLLFANNGLDKTINDLMTKSDSLNKEIKNSDWQLLKLKNRRNETIRIIDSLDRNKLLEFFSAFNSADSSY